MGYLTDRKRAAGLGSAKQGTEHHWFMQVSAVGLAIVVPIFIFLVGPLLGAPHAEVVATFSRPFPAIITALVVWASMVHFKKGAITMIEDYAHGFARKALIIAVTCISYAVMATGLYALARMAL